MCIFHIAAPVYAGYLIGMKTYTYFKNALGIALAGAVGCWAGQIIDHRHTVLNSIPLEAIQQAKDSLHIAYGHTSHGSQLMAANGYGDYGLNGLRGVNGVFLTTPDGGQNGLHLLEGSGYDDNANSLMVGDAGWDAASGNGLRFVAETRKFLGSPNSKGRGSARPEFNVILWSWCGQVSYHGDETFDHYFTGMDSLRKEYPSVQFVLMTGHLDGTGVQGQLHQRNERIRTYAQTNNLWLFDFADIDSHDPDGVDYLSRFANDENFYDSDGNGSLDANWARDWTALHPEQVDQSITYAHTEPINGQRKVIAAWWLFATMAGWNGPNPSIIQPKQVRSVYSKFKTSQEPYDLLGRTIKRD